MKRRCLIAIGSSIIGSSVSGCLASERANENSIEDEGNNSNGSSMKGSENDEEVIVDGTFDHAIVRNFETEVGTEIYMHVDTLSGESTWVKLLDQQDQQAIGMMGDELEETYVAEKNKYTIKTEYVAGEPTLYTNSTETQNETEGGSSDEEPDWEYHLKVTLRR